jgi:hypothetical protein
MRSEHWRHLAQEKAVRHWDACHAGYFDGFSPTQQSVHPYRPHMYLAGENIGK